MIIQNITVSKADILFIADNSFCKCGPIFFSEADFFFFPYEVCYLVAEFGNLSVIQPVNSSCPLFVCSATRSSE